MGQTYAVSLKLQFKDKQGAAQALRAKITRATQEQAVYALDHYREIGIGTDKIEGLLCIFFGGWEGKLQNTGKSLESGFDASYGWETVMMDAFDLMAPFIRDGSEITIYPDSGMDKAIVQGGRAVWG